MTHHAPPVERMLDEAVCFVPWQRRGAAGRRLRVARAPVTFQTVVAVMNALRVPAETESVYRFVNVHNPRSPLFFDAERGGWRCREGVAQHPAWGVNWAGARLICAHLGARLPYEWEWERIAANNEPGRSYPWGEAEPDASLANYGEHLGGTSEVGAFPASEIGLYDLAGNLSEWCLDAFGPQSATCVDRVAKGGAWSKDAHHLAIAARRGKWERLGTTTIGFRPVWDD